MADCVATKIEQLYCEVSVPSVTHTQLVQLTKAYPYYKLRKPYNWDKTKDSYKTKIESFVADGRSKLFDTTACTCEMTYSCACGRKPSSCDCFMVIECNCEIERESEKEKKIPLLKRKFMYDQRTIRTVA